MECLAGPSAGHTSPRTMQPNDHRPAPTGPVRTPNVRLRTCREERGWSQERLASELRRFSVIHEGREAGVTGNMICKWEKGDKKPSLRYQRLLRALFERSSAELGFVDDDPNTGLTARVTAAATDRVSREIGPAGTLLIQTEAGPDPSGDIPVERRGFLRLFAAAGGVAVVPLSTAGPDNAPWERLSAALRRRTTVTPELADELSRCTAGLYSLEERVPARALFPRVTGHLGTLTQLLESSGRSTARRDLASTAGETAALAGWLAFDMNDIP
ncbi:helix-turn-helix transcriptional regulator, partial [Frankia sp. EI5c]|uniref:helix-turn-helix domain-containing protein n=1 Tax=Frankia sp. EI5c TaxID=683316 RepID=UPI001F5BDC4B